MNSGSAENSSTASLELTSSANFSGAHHFTVAGGTFNSITKNYITPAPIFPPDFRTIPLGDIDLQNEICLGTNTGIVDCERVRPRVRRVYSATIDGRKLGVTVAMYLGASAEEEWRQDIANYMTVRHPNIIQVHAAAASSNYMYATVFHDELVPFDHFLNVHRHSPILTVYIHAYCQTEFKATRDYLSSTFQRFLVDRECTFFIRHSTGRLCVDLVRSNNKYYWFPTLEGVSRSRGIKPLKASNEVAMAIDSLTLYQYHRICYWNLSQDRHLYCSTSATVNLNTIIAWPSRDPLEDLVEIASLPDAEVDLSRCQWTTSGETTGEVLENGWTRFASDDIIDSTLQLYVWNWAPEFWISQANHIFSCLQVSSNFEDYVVPDDIYFRLVISVTSNDPPLAFLFLCPPDHFRTGSSSFRWPDCPAYWSLDPSGLERLNVDDAIRLGFPSISLSTDIEGWSWDASVYAGLRQFHQAKGFNADSQDVARHLGHPLFQLSGEIGTSFAHMDDEDHCSEDDEDPLNQSEHKGISTTKDHMQELMAGGEEPELEDHIPPVSRTFKVIMISQMTLMLFLSLSWLYDQAGVDMRMKSSTAM